MPPVMRRCSYGPENLFASPIKAGEDWLLDLEGVEKVLEIDGQCRGLTVAHCFARQKSRRAVAAEVRNDHPVPRPCEHRRDVDKAVNVVGPTVQQNDGATI